MVESEHPALVLQREARVKLMSEELRSDPAVGEKEDVTLIRGWTHAARVVSALICSRKEEQEDVMLVGIKVESDWYESASA